MQRLAIPLSRHTSTTRRYRRVVWLLGVFGLVFASACWAGAYGWWTRDTLTGQVPDGTVAYIRFTPTTKNWDDIGQFFHNTPLISSRSLTMEDIAPYVSGEFALLFSEEGTYALAIRTKKGGLPRSELDAHGIVIQETGKNTFILSDRLLPLSEHAWPRGWRFPFTLPGRARMGTFAFTEPNPIGGSVLRTSKGLEFRMPKNNEYTKEIEYFPETTVAVLSTQVLPKDGFHELMSSIDALLTGLNVQGATWVVEALTQEPDGWLVLASEDDKMHYILNFPNKTAENGKDLIRGIASLHQPTTRSWTLPDQSLATELIVDPSTVTVEEFTSNGKPVFRVSAGESELLAAAFESGVLVTDNKALLDFYLQEDLTSPANVFCAKPIFALSLPKLTNFFSTGTTMRSEALLNVLSQNASSIVLRKGIFSQSLVLCE